MSKLRRCSSSEIIRILKKHGFEEGTRKASSHRSYIRSTPTGKLTVVVVLGKKELPEGTLRSILRQARISEAVYLQELR